MLRGLWRRARGGLQTPSDNDTDDEASQPTTGGLVRAGQLVRLRTHVPVNREAFQRWYADPEIAELLRHDQEPLDAAQSKNYFDSFILPLSARGYCFAIHEAATDRLIGTTALTDVAQRRRGPRLAMFRIVIGEKDLWGRGYGTEATRLVMEEAFDTHDLDQVRLEVFRHNPRAIAAYRRVGFQVTGEHFEPIGAAAPSTSSRWPSTTTTSTTTRMTTMTTTTPPRTRPTLRPAPAPSRAARPRRVRPPVPRPWPRRPPMWPAHADLRPSGPPAEPAAPPAGSAGLSADRSGKSG